MNKWDLLDFPDDKRALRIIVDTSSFMQEHAEAMLERIFVPLVEETGIKLVVPLQVSEEIERHLGSKDSDLRKKAERADDLFRKFKARELIDVYGGSEKTFTDNVIMMVIVRFCEKYHFCLVTQDRALAADILKLTQRQSVTRMKTITAVRIGQDGDIARWLLDPSNSKGAVWERVVVDKQSNEINRAAPATEVEKFHLRSGPTRVDNRILAVSSHATKGSLLFDDAGMKIQLGERIGAGGEGTVFATSENQVCKVYEGQRLTAGTRAKIELMLRKPVHHPGICWPLSLARNESNEFVGYFMNRATGRELQRAVFVKPLLEQIFPEWTRVQLVVLTMSILELVLLLHERNVLLGDISPRNILVKDEKTVFFVDTDSYQIEDFPCPVGTATFLPPELRGQDLSSVLREMRHEHFALATLIFMMLMPGKPPYSHAGGGDPAENVRTRHFPYALGEKRGMGVPDGPWRFMWSHLPFYLKEVFHQVFSDEKRVSAADWQKTMKRYYSDLTNAYLSHEIFPASFKLLNEAGELRKTSTRQPLPDKGGTAFVSDGNAKTSKRFRPLYESVAAPSKNKTDDSEVISLGIAEGLKVFTDIKGTYCLVYDPKIQGKAQGQSRGDAVVLWHAHWKKTYSYHPHTFRTSMVEVASNGLPKKRFVETLSAYLSWQETSGKRLIK